ncbi:hypothetical protein H9Y04_36370 [Streptomyces sp. TRM66268-LWL]|uniref:Uncharacterized protein n=1 Tax=Streptomyces polyasparticus TaxID=2767826 RepID=A0ABR7SRL1_9ACTN|nr:hypothetical protein [Streptomyces polyasparticus]MBC9718023.1 hypothetical protein [Streptomyces polyasparticus]
MNTTDATTPEYAPELWLGSRLARDFTGSPDPLDSLDAAHRHGGPLAKFAQLIILTVRELDTLDADTEALRVQLAHRAAHGSRYSDGPFRDARAVHELAAELADHCARRTWTATQLRRLLAAFTRTT